MGSSSILTAGIENFDLSDKLVRQWSIKLTSIIIVLGIDELNGGDETRRGPRLGPWVTAPIKGQEDKPAKDFKD